MAGYESEKLGDLMCTHNILNEEDKKWYFSECKRVFKDLHYNLDRRASGDNALKLFLISKGYPIKKALDLSWMKPEDFKKSFKQFLDECANPNKTPEENVKAIAEMNKKAMKAISEYTIPDFSNIKSDKDLAKYQLEIQAMGSLIIDWTQDMQGIDTEPWNTKALIADKTTEPDYHMKRIYYNTVGGNADFESLRYKLIMYGQYFGLVFDPVFSGKRTVTAKATALAAVKVFTKDLAGKKIKDIDVGLAKKLNCYHTMLTAFTPNITAEILAKDVPPKEYVDYLAGKTKENKSFEDLKKAVDDFTPVFMDGANETTDTELNAFLKNGVSKFNHLIDEDLMTTDNLLSLNEDKRTQLEDAYYGTFGTFYRSTNIFNAFNLAKDEFDLIFAPDGRTIRQIVEAKYSGLSEEQKMHAMMLEAMKIALISGVRCRYVKFEPDGRSVYSPVKQLESTYLKSFTDKASNDFEEQMDATREDRHSLLKNPDSDTFRTTDQMSQDEISEAAKLYDQTFGALFNTSLYTSYKKSHPLDTDLDLFTMGAGSLRAWLGPERLNKLLNAPNRDELIKAEIMILASDPKINLNYKEIIYDPVNNDYRSYRTVDIIDRADKELIITQRPYMQSVESYKEWFKKEYKNFSGTDRFSDDDWKDLYRESFHSLAQQSLVPMDKITSVEEMREEFDPDISANVVLSNLKALYGAKPSFVTEWAGNEKGEGKFYSAQEYSAVSQEFESDVFYEGEFAILALLTSLNPDVIEKDVLPELSDLNVSHSNKIRLRDSDWTTKLLVGKKGNPSRDDFKHVKDIILPARQATAEMIAQYEQGESEALSENVAFGIRRLMDKVRLADEFRDPMGEASLNAHFLAEVMKVMDNNFELQQTVLGKLSNEEFDFMKSICKMAELMDKKQKALAELDREETEDLEIDPDQRDIYINDIAKFDSYAERWDQFVSNLRNEEYQKVSKTLIGAMEGAAEEAKASGEDLSLTFQVSLDDYKLTKFKPDQELTEDLINESPDRAPEFKMSELINACKALTQKYITYHIEAQSIKKRELKNVYPEDITPEISLGASRKEADYEYVMAEYTKLLKDCLTADQIKDIVNEYNKLSKAKKWKVKADPAFLGSKALLADTNQEALTAYFDIIHKKLERNPGNSNVANLLENIKNIKLPEQRELKDQVFNKQADDIKKLKDIATTDEDKAFLDEVDLIISDITPEIYDYYDRHEDRSRTVAIADGQAEKNREDFAGGILKGLFVEESLPGDMGDFSYTKDQEKMNALINAAPKVDENTKQGIINIVNKILDYKILDKTSTTEDGGKIYVHRKVVKSREALKKAVTSGKMEEIRKAYDAYQKDCDEIRELFRLTEEVIPEKIYVPGNVNSLRNRAVPPEFALNVTTESKVNGLYLMALGCNMMNVPVEEVIENPGKHLLDYMKKVAKDNGIDKYNHVEGKDSFIASFKALHERGEYLVGDSNSIEQDTVGSTGRFIGRVMDAVNYSLKDKEAMAEYSRYKNYIILQGINILDSENSRQGMLYRVVTDTKMPEAMVKEMKQGLKMAFLEGSNIQHRHLPGPYTNEDNVEIPRPGYEDFLATKNQYKKIIENYQKCYNDRDETDLNLAFEVVEEAMFDYLMAHPEDSKKPEYKELEKIALSAGKKLDVDYSDVEKGNKPSEKYDKWKKAYNLEYNELYSEAKERDNAVNKRFARLQKELVKLSKIKNTAAENEFNKMKDIMEKLITERTKELIEGYRLKKITETYLKQRIKDMNALKDDYKAKIKNPPKFLDDSNPENLERDTKMINGRLQDTLGEGHLKDMKAFKAWKLQQKGMELLQEDELTKEDWQMLYRKEVYLQMKNTPLPDGIEDPTENEMEQIQKEAEKKEEIAHAILEQDIVANLGGDGKFNSTDIKDAKSIKEFKIKGLKDKLTTGTMINGRLDDIIGRIVDPNTMPAVKSIQEDLLISFIAEPVGYDIISRTGKVPNNMSPYEFNMKIGNDKAFKRVIKPLLEAVYEDYRQYKQNPEGFEFDAYKNITEMINNKAILSAYKLEQDYLKSNSPEDVKQDDLSGKVSPGVLHAGKQYYAIKTRKSEERAMGDQIVLHKEPPKNQKPKDIRHP